MLAYRTLCVLVVVVVGVVRARSADGMARMEKLFSADTSSTATALDAAAEHSVNKRAVFDQSCKGVYDRSLFGKLDRVCDDCYNLYRKHYVSTGCRKNCYGNLVFRQCLDDLLLLDVVDEYVASVQSVGK
nr:crustacean hyperglycaemic hormone isoform 2 [Panulirus japonicus]